ncbi:MAG TPA: ribosome-associated translation inhibitor RaiA [Candidatus Pacebacteria bacterium]|nr:ribosome-associated translation inhibitor RaiA [Candidatus Paceibacterota bacterium]
MQVLVEGKKLTITVALRNFVKQQAGKFETLGLRVRQVRVFLETVTRKTGEANRSEVKFKVELPGKDVIVEKKGQDMYAAIVAATERVKFQLQKLKQKHLERRQGKAK